LSAHAHRRSHRLADERGSVLVESALTHMIGMALVLGIMEIATMAYTFGVISEAARTGVRYATMHGADSSNCSGPTTGCGDTTGAHVASQVTGFAGIFTRSATSMSVTVTYPDTTGSNAPSRVEVAVSYTYKPLFGISATGHVFHVAEQGRIMY
jgi:hypothetical protein